MVKVAQNDKIAALTEGRVIAFWIQTQTESVVNLHVFNDSRIR